MPSPQTSGHTSRAAIRFHLDTDLGGDPDDACALALLLGWPGVEVLGITTTIDPGGRRAACVEHCLRLAGRDDIPVEAGADVSMTTKRTAKPYAGEPYWPNSLRSKPSPPGAALDLLSRSIEQGATIIGIGPYTNLAHLEKARPGSLAQVPVVVMGGWTEPPAKGLPAWGPDRDWNVQFDTRAAELVANATTRLTLVTLSATLKAHLRAADLRRLRAAGPLGELLAQQSAAHAEDRGMSELARANDGLPDDLLNFHYDPVTCAVALGWRGAVVEEKLLRPAPSDEVFRWYPEDQDGKRTRVVVDVDGERFRERWLSAVEAAARA